MIISVAIAIVIAMALAILLSRFRKAAVVVMPLISVFQTIPGIVFIGLLMLRLGMTPLTVIMAPQYLCSVSYFEKCISGFY